MTKIERGEELTEGSIDPKELIKVKDVASRSRISYCKKYKKYTVCKVLKLVISTLK